MLFHHSLGRSYSLAFLPSFFGSAPIPHFPIYFQFRIRIPPSSPFPSISNIVSPSAAPFVCTNANLHSPSTLGQSIVATFFPTPSGPKNSHCTKVSSLLCAAQYICRRAYSSFQKSSISLLLLGLFARQPATFPLPSFGFISFLHPLFLHSSTASANWNSVGHIVPSHCCPLCFGFCWHISLLPPTFKTDLLQTF